MSITIPSLSNSQKAFTLVETLIAVLIIGILGSITYTISVANGADRGKFNASISDLAQIGQAVKVYVTNNNDYPDWVDKNTPPGNNTITGLTASTPFGLQAADNSNWPKGQWTGAQYHYEVLPNTSGGEPTIQVELRFCPNGLTPCKKPTGKWATNMIASNATMFYCIKPGADTCRSTSYASTKPTGTLPTVPNGICVGGEGCTAPKYQ